MKSAILTTMLVMFGACVTDEPMLGAAEGEMNGSHEDEPQPVDPPDGDCHLSACEEQGLCLTFGLSGYINWDSCSGSGYIYAACERFAGSQEINYDRCRYQDPDSSTGCTYPSICVGVQVTEIFGPLFP